MWYVGNGMVWGGWVAEMEICSRCFVGNARRSFKIYGPQLESECRRGGVGMYRLLSKYKGCSLMSLHGLITRKGSMCILLQDSSGVTFAGGRPFPLRLRKKRIFLPIPSALSEGSTHWQVRALVHMAFRKPQGPPSTLER